MQLRFYAYKSGNIVQQVLPINRTLQHQLTAKDAKEIGNSSGGPNFSIDLRPNRRPDRMRIPLYPLTGSFPYKAAIRSFYSKSGILNNLVCSAFGASAQQVILADSGTAVLIYWLEWLRLQNGGSLAIALPSFFCSETAVAIRDNGIRIVLLELSETLQLSQQSVDFAVQQGCKVLIWPNYFGYRLRDKNVLKRAKENGLLVMFDEAHTFPPAEPCSYELPQEITLFSFGPNKPLAGNGGGGMYFPDSMMASSVNRFIERKKSWRRPTWAAVLDDAKSVIQTRTIRWMSHKNAVRFGLDGVKTIDPPCGPASCLADAPFPALNHYQSEIAALRWRQRCEVMPAHSECVTNLQAEILELWSPVHVRMLPRTCDVPAMFAVCIPSQQRHKLSVALAAQGIQTTWYYYPLHRLTAFQEFSSEPMPVSDQLASELLMLPCHWVHTKLRQTINARDLEAAVKWLMSNEQLCA
jgi:dTDP-4-amino-4,6-dideoxygalactose transaminase